ncbi:HNH endonuclease [Flagellatimonas centrodinii]|uniref:HNH endonuclease n=1 Tax=Flagellatimonas centrodinii TaxID=2806210 RepID=UPI001FEDA7F7|nr:HNH endonuclease signature motif containing protein [Flagellatimonas centrodinii]ULQ45390.1 HNH endonuclease [Flagellatimonas centrodinii]
MGRAPGSTMTGTAFDAATVEAVWQRGLRLTGMDPSFVRADICGAIMVRDQYGRCRPGGVGWEIDHIQPVARGGTDALDNLQPMQWENNRAKGDDLPGDWSPAQWVARRG